MANLLLVGLSAIILFKNEAASAATMGPHAERRLIWLSAATTSLARVCRRNAGVAEWKAGETLVQTFSRAQAALHETKTAGHNRVRAALDVAPA